MNTWFSIFVLIISVIGSVFYYLRRRARESLRQDFRDFGSLITARMAEQEENEAWVRNTMKHVYGENYHTLSQCYSDGHLFEAHSGLFTTHHTSSQKLPDPIVGSEQPFTGPNTHPNYPEIVKGLMYDFSAQQNFRSNAIEKSSLSLQETRMVVQRDLTPTAKPIKDVLAALDHQAAWRLMESFIPSRKITHQTILQLHALVTRSDLNARPGELRQVNEFVRISHSKVLLAHPVEVPSLLNKLISWLDSTQDHPIDKTINFHQRFIRIHPFVDGNGRTCRLLCTLILLQADYGPLLFMKVSNEEYFEAIRSWEQENNTEKFAEMVRLEIIDVMNIHKTRIDDMLIESSW